MSDPLEPGSRYTAKVNVRESAIAHMASRGRINPSQEAAGERFRLLWEKARIGRQIGIDPAKEFVDGGRLGDPMTDDLVRAGRELAKAVRAVGAIGAKLLMDVVGEGKLIEKVATDWSKAGGPVKGERAEGYVTGRLVEALDDLVRVWKLEGEGKPDNQPGFYLRNGKVVEVRDDIRASGPIAVSGATYEISVGRFGDVCVEEIIPVDRTALMEHVSGNVGPCGRK